MGTLETLKVKNLALIDCLEINFGKGLNIITGETGAGKSILMNSLLFILGKRALSNIIRKGKDKCIIEAIFDVDGHDDYLIIKREFSRDNKNKVKINDEFVTLSKLRNFTNSLIDFSTQDQYLFDSKNQLLVYDEFCGLKNKIAQFRDLFKRFEKLKLKVLEKERNKEEVQQRLELLKYQLNELEDIELEDIDESELKREIEYYENIEKIKDVLNTTLQQLENIHPVLGEIKAKFYEIKDFKKIFSEISNLIENVDVELKEISYMSLNELSNLPEEDDKLNSLIELEDKITNLKKKFKKSSIEELITFREEIKENIKKLENFEIEISKEKKEIDDLNKRLQELAEEIHNIRISKKVEFERGVESILKLLNLEKAKFEVNIEKMENYTETGYDRINFLISPNVGEEPKEIKDVASGGEKSRIMLALKAFLSEYLNIPIIVFDEIDAGTGGETAFAVGKLLKRLSKNHQVFAITHFPQVAAFADHHFKVFKYTENGETFTSIKKLNFSERIEELARMISGNITERSMMSAEELINEAEKSDS